MPGTYFAKRSAAELVPYCSAFHSIRKQDRAGQEALTPTEENESNNSPTQNHGEPEAGALSANRHIPEAPAEFVFTPQPERAR